MKALRRSLKGCKDEVKVHSHHTSIPAKDALAILPPKKVIRALYDYEANPKHPQELSFSKGDFFHVIGRENDADWYEACNRNARGMVPVQFFEILARNERDSAGSSLSRTSGLYGDGEIGESDRSEKAAANDHPPTSHPSRISTGQRGAGAMVYGVVQYDFAAERPDELEAKRGEAIIVIAQSNPEWFVAKPIGRLGGPGLIPVSFIELRDMATGEAVADPHEAVRRAGVPKVEEWKKMAANYKNSSIPLGQFNLDNSQQRMQQGMDRLSVGTGRQSYQNGYPNGQQQQQQQQSRASHQRVASGSATIDPQNPYSRPSSAQVLAPLSACIPRWYFAGDKYWYVIEAVMEDGRHWELSRAYQDFYDFQIALLSEFPEEAGNAGKQRTLPFMPGPVTYVTVQISHMRRESLDDYIKKLLRMSSYISRCHLVRQLFAPKEGDRPIEGGGGDSHSDGHNDGHNDAVAGYRRLSGGSQPSSGGLSPNGVTPQSSGSLNGAAYHSHPYSHPHNTFHSHQYQQGYQPSQPALGRPGGQAPRHQRQQSPSYSNGVAPSQAMHYRSPSSSDGQMHQYPPKTRPEMTRQASSLTQVSNGSQGTTAVNSTASASVTGGAGNNPTGAMKIKVYYQDDLIAIRVPTDITFDQLMEKVQARLSLGGGGGGGDGNDRDEAVRIQYKNEPSNTYESLQNDEDLFVALQRNPKLAIYVNY